MSEHPGTESVPAATPLLWAPEPEPLGVPFEPTGHPEVDAELAGLERLDGVPTVEHPAVYENVQQRLNTILTSLDEHA
ncbi:hypothetical protein [Kitasatospora viridis]|uniref:Uncharacterized protein n=1 Tax=Kitasatospora viridis TaxID=281105 RepID=A0A561UCX5_9ACTN|nr:hypothetical protein [Kitasatospora viridis]TWF97198.1 hypothetical protein FHX73_11974 [Kitasatospora viridis]